MWVPAEGPDGGLGLTLPPSPSPLFVLTLPATPFQVFRELGTLVDAAPDHEVYVSAAVWDLLRPLAGTSGELVDCARPAFRLLRLAAPAAPAARSGGPQFGSVPRPAPGRDLHAFDDVLHGYLCEPVVEHLKASHQVRGCVGGLVSFAHARAVPPF